MSPMQQSKHSTANKGQLIGMGFGIVKQSNKNIQLSDKNKWHQTKYKTTNEHSEP